MSPKNQSAEFEREPEDQPMAFEPKRAVSRGPMQRSKRIRNGRRANSTDGMQRRRNKRVDW